MKNDNKHLKLRCETCGKFISLKDFEAGDIKYFFVPDTAFSPELEFWIHNKCLKIEEYE